MLPVALSAAITIGAGTAIAAEPPSPGAAITRRTDGLWNMPLRHFGYNELQLKGQLASTEAFVGIPDGLTPVALQGTLKISPDVLGGYLEFRSGDDVLRTEVLSRARHLDAGAAVSVPLSGVRLRDRTLALTLNARIRTTDDACEAAVIGTRMDFLNGAILLKGSGTPPATIGNYLPKALTRLRVYVPETPNAGEGTAALGIAMAILDRYTGQRVTVELEELSSLANAGFHPFERAIVIRRGGPGKMLLEQAGKARRLVLSGSQAAIRRQAAVFARDLGALAVGKSVTVLELDEQDSPTSSRKTFEELGVRQYQSSGVGRLEIPIPFSQYDLGGARNLKVRLAGVYTPVTKGGSATLGMLINGVLVRAITLGASGEFDVSIDVPADLVRRENTLLVRVDYGPPEGVCRLGIRPFTFEIAKNSYFDVGERAALGEGFLRFPQVLRSGFNVAFERTTVSGLRAALYVLTSLQRLAGSALRPSVLSWDRAMRAKQPAFFIGDNAKRVHALKPPVDPYPFRVMDAAGSTVLEMGVEDRFAVLSAFQFQRRDILLLTGRNPAELVVDLTRGLEADPDGWFGLTGDVYLLAESSPPVNLNLRARTLRAQALGDDKEASFISFRLAPLIAALGVAFLGLTFLYPRLVRRLPNGATHGNTDND